MSEVGAQPRGAISHARSSSCVGTGGLKGATPHSRSGGVAMKRYPTSKDPSEMMGDAGGHQRADTLKP